MKKWCRLQRVCFQVVQRSVLLWSLAKEWTLREKQSWSSLLKFFVLTFALVRVGFCRARIQIRVRLPLTINQGRHSPHKIVRPTSPDEIRCNLEVCLQGCTWLSKLLYGRVHTGRICNTLSCGFVGRIKAIQPSVDASSDLTLLWRRKCQRLVVLFRGKGRKEWTKSFLKFQKTLVILVSVVTETLLCVRESIQKGPLDQSSCFSPTCLRNEKVYLHSKACLVLLTWLILPVVICLS